MAETDSVAWRNINFDSRGRKAAGQQREPDAFDQFRLRSLYATISGPSWLDSVRFDIQAKGQTGLKVADIRLMAQALLANRFGLHCHRETKEAKVYSLLLASGELKMRMQPADEPQRRNAEMPPGPHRTMGGDWTVEELAAQLSRAVKVPVIDRSGVSGKFHCCLWWGDDPDTDPDVLQAVKEQLGLKLEAARSEVEFLVVERVSRTPTEN